MGQAVNTFPHKKRYLSDRPQQYQEYLRAAEEYVDNLDDATTAYLYSKPYVLTPGNQTFYRHMYDVLNLLNTMNIRPHGRILEVGSGPGWVTEILMGLGFEVDAVEPSRRFIEIAQKRVNTFMQHLQISNPPQVTFHCTTLEDCTLPDKSCDAVLFYAALHHIIDENKGLAQCFRILRDGGVLGVHEGAWVPGDKQLEEILDQEMKRYGTLENPYTTEYLDYLLHKYGFTQIVHYSQVNGLFSKNMEHKTLREAAQAISDDYNILTAIKPRLQSSTLDFDADTRAEIKIVTVDFDVTLRKVHLKVKLVNRGETIWLNKSTNASGYVTLSMCSGKLGAPDFEEAQSRIPIPEEVYPGKEITLEVNYYLPLVLCQKEMFG